MGFERRTETTRVHLIDVRCDTCDWVKTYPGDATHAPDFKTIDEADPALRGPTTRRWYCIHVCMDKAEQDLNQEHRARG